MRAPDGLEWLTVAEVAERLGVNPARVRQWVSRGRVRSVRSGARRWVCWQDATTQERAARSPRRRALTTPHAGSD